MWEAGVLLRPPLTASWLSQSLTPGCKPEPPPHALPKSTNRVSAGAAGCYQVWNHRQARLLPTGLLMHVLHVSARPTGHSRGEDSVTIHVYRTGLYGLPHTCVSPEISECDVTWKSVLQISSVQMRSSWMKVGPESRSGVLRR